MSPLAEFDQKMESMIRELILRIMVPSSREFDRVCEIANKICDRYNLPRADYETFIALQPQCIPIDEGNGSIAHSPMAGVAQLQTLAAGRS